MSLHRVSRVEVKRKDAVYKKMDKQWRACPNCAGVFITVCSNGCHLSDAEMQRFVTFLNMPKGTR